MGQVTLSIRSPLDPPPAAGWAVGGTLLPVPMHPAPKALMALTQQVPMALLMHIPQESMALEARMALQVPMSRLVPRGALIPMAFPDTSYLRVMAPSPLEPSERVLCRIRGPLCGQPGTQVGLGTSRGKTCALNRPRKDIPAPPACPPTEAAHRLRATRRDRPHRNAKR